MLKGTLRFMTGLYATLVVSRAYMHHSYAWVIIGIACFVTVVLSGELVNVLKGKPLA